MSEKIIEVIYVSSERMAGLKEICMDMDFEVICPVPEKPYGGTIHIKYRPRVETLYTTLVEWNSLQEKLKSIRSESYTAEELACSIAQDIASAVDSEEVSVEVSVNSAFHLPVKVVAQI